MGMSAYGEPKYFNELSRLVNFTSDGKFEIDQNPFNFLTPIKLPFNDKLEKLLGKARIPDSNFNLDVKNSSYEDNKRFADIASSIQKLTEILIISIIKKGIKITNNKNVCLSGGCALNSLANNRIVKELGVNLYVQPASGDSGSSLGAALYYTHQLKRYKRQYQMRDVYLGPEYSDSEILEAINQFKIKPFNEFNDVGYLCKCVAKLITEGNVIGWFQGRSEWGPRSLGNRSILADPTNTKMKEIINSKIKFREPFRPFAPSVLVEFAHEYFDINELLNDTDPYNFMLQVCKVKENVKNTIPSVTHVDGTARVHTVREESNKIFHNLISEIRNINKVPIVLNTSFNVRGEPIVDSPVDAIKTFLWCDMDYLVLGTYILKKEKLV
jgi:carbamoyltransferase